MRQKKRISLLSWNLGAKSRKSSFGRRRLVFCAVVAAIAALAGFLHEFVLL